MTTPTLTQDLERLRLLVEKRVIMCPGTHVSVLNHRCKVCGQWVSDDAGFIPDPTWAGVLNVLREKCLHCCGDGRLRVPKLGGMALAGAWYETELSDEPCSQCQGTGYILRPQWQELADAGIGGALEGALGCALGETIPSVTVQALMEMLEKETT